MDALLLPVRVIITFYGRSFANIVRSLKAWQTWAILILTGLAYVYYKGAEGDVITALQMHDDKLYDLTYKTFLTTQLILKVFWIILSLWMTYYLLVEPLIYTWKYTVSEVTRGVEFLRQATSLDESFTESAPVDITPKPKQIEYTK